MFDANGNPIFSVSEWTAITSVAVGAALILLVAAVITAMPRRK